MAQPGKDDYQNMLRGWFERDLGRYARWDRDVELVEIERDGTIRIVIYTDVHSFAISCGPGSSGQGYLGCIGNTRKPRAGEDWTRGNDLRDGPLSEETWFGILGDIISYELVRVHKEDHVRRKVSSTRGGRILDPRVDDEGQIPPTHTADKPAHGTIMVSENGNPMTVWPPGMEAQNVSEPDDSYRTRLLEGTFSGDRATIETIKVASGWILDLIGAKYGMPRFGVGQRLADHVHTAAAAEETAGA